MGVELNPKPQTLQLGGQSLVFYHAKVAVSDVVLANRCNKLYWGSTSAPAIEHHNIVVWTLYRYQTFLVEINVIDSMEQRGENQPKFCNDGLHWWDGNVSEELISGGKRARQCMGGEIAGIVCCDGLCVVFGGGGDVYMLLIGIRAWCRVLM